MTAPDRAEHEGRKVERLKFEGVPGAGTTAWNREKRTYFGTVPTVAEGHTRLWRSTDIPREGQAGWWSAKPLPAYGGSMLYMDLPHEEATHHEISSQPGIYLVPKGPNWRDMPMPGQVNRVKYEEDE